MANLSAINFSLHIYTADTSFCHVAPGSLASQWTISPCKWALTSQLLASMFATAVARCSPLAKSFHLSAGNSCFSRQYIALRLDQVLWRKKFVSIMTYSFSPKIYISQFYGNIKVTSRAANIYCPVIITYSMHKELSESSFWLVVAL